MAICPASEGLVRGLVDSVDCHIRVLVHDAYRDLVGPNTTFAAVFTAMLTIYIALIGYQMLLGRGALRLTMLPALALKIGVIMAFLTSWAAYQTVIFSFLFDGPREILGPLLAPMDIGSGGDMYDGVENAYAVLSETAAIYGAQANPAANILQGGPMLGAGLLWLSAIGLLLITAGVIVAAKIVLGFLLAIGPVFVALFLFDSTRGLFDGWLRATLAFAVAPIAANVFGAAMLIMMSPFLDILAENASLNAFDMGPIVTLGLIVMVFAIVMAMALRAAATIAGGFVTPWRSRELFVAPRGAAEGAAAPGAPTAPATGRFSRTEGESAISAARRTEIMIETRAGASDVAIERLGQAYRRGPGGALSSARGAA
jgi:type IV secretion system protein VirB6